MNKISRLFLSYFSLIIFFIIHTIITESGDSNVIFFMIGISLGISVLLYIYNIILVYLFFNIFNIKNIITFIFPVFIEICLYKQLDYLFNELDYFIRYFTIKLIIFTLMINLLVYKYFKQKV